LSKNNRGGVCTFYTVLLSREWSAAGGRRFGENSSLLHGIYQAWSGVGATIAHVAVKKLILTLTA
jgi:hypothetical protein